MMVMITLIHVKIKKYKNIELFEFDENNIKFCPSSKKSETIKKVNESHILTYHLDISTINNYLNGGIYKKFSVLVKGKYYHYLNVDEEIILTEIERN